MPEKTHATSCGEAASTFFTGSGFKASMENAIDQPTADCIFWGIIDS